VLISKKRATVMATVMAMVTVMVMDMEIILVKNKNSTLK
jgi:hypothetical protein